MHARTSFVQDASPFLERHVERRYPGAPRAELERFAAARPVSADDALVMYAEYLAWREGDGARDGLAARSAACGQDQFLCVGGETGSGEAVLLIQGARYDVEKDPKLYLDAVCATLDSVCCDDSQRRVVVLIDVRAGEKWHNPPARLLVPFVRLCAGLVPRMYPERLKTVVVYPLPAIVRGLCYVILALLDPVTKNKIVLFGGSDNKRAPCPADELRQHVNLDMLPSLAHDRHSGL